MEDSGTATARRFTPAVPALLGVFALMLTATGTLQAQGVVLTTPINTFAGNGTAGATGDGGLATAAELSAPEGLAFDTKGNVYIADYNNNLIRVVNAAGVISTFAGTTTPCANPTAATGACGDGGPVSAATFNNPAQMQFDSAGNLYIADYTDNRVRKVTATNGVITGSSIITTVAGNGSNGAVAGNGGAATAAVVPLPHGIAIDASGNIYISDQLACVIRKVTASNGNIANFAGNGTCGYAGDTGQANAAGAEINGAVDISLDSAGNLYIADRLNNVVRKVTASTNVISTYAGVHGTACTPTTATCGDNGAATSAFLSGPAAVAFDASGNLVIADADGARIRKVTVSTGNITTIAGTGAACNANGTASGACGDGGSALQAKFSFPIGVALNSNNGFVYFTDQYANRVRYLAPAPSFPATNVGAASPALNTIFTTTGTSNTIINSISVPNSPSGTPQFTVGTLTGCVLGGAGNAPGTVCTIPVTFTPSYPGVQSEPLIIVTNGNTLQVGLTGTGVAPQAVLLPGVLSTVVNTAGTAETTPGTGNSGQAASATLKLPRDINFDYAGNYYIGDIGNGQGTSNTAEIRKVTPSTGVISQFAGAGSGTTAYSSTSTGVAATSVGFNYASQAVFDAAGNAYIPDFFHNVVARVDAVTGNITAYAGQYGVIGSTGDGGQATAAKPLRACLPGHRSGHGKPFHRRRG